MSKNSYTINNLQELQVKMISLKVDYKMKEIALKEDVSDYAKQFTPGHLFKKYVTSSSVLKTDDKLNFTSKIMSLALPVLLNSTLFRGSGFLTKTLVGLATSKVGKSIDASQLTSIFTHVKGFFGSSKKKQKSAYVDYGIPPDSETF